MMNKGKGDAVGIVPPPFFPQDVTDMLSLPGSGAVDELKVVFAQILTISKQPQFRQSDADALIPMIRRTDITGMNAVVVRYAREKSSRIIPTVLSNVQPVVQGVELPKKPGQGRSVAGFFPVKFDLNKQKRIKEDTLGVLLKTKFQDWIVDPSIAKKNYVCNALTKAVNSHAMANLVLGMALVLGLLLICVMGYMIWGFLGVASSPPISYQGTAGNFSINTSNESVAEANPSTIQTQVSGLVTQLGDFITEVESWMSGVNAELYGTTTGRFSKGLVASLEEVKEELKDLKRYLPGPDSSFSRTRAQKRRFQLQEGGVVRVSRRGPLAVLAKRSLLLRVSGMRLGNQEILSEQRNLILEVNRSVWAKFRFLENNAFDGSNGGAVSNFGVIQKFRLQGEAISSINTSLVSRLEILEGVCGVVVPDNSSANASSTVGKRTSQDDFQKLMSRMKEMEGEIRRLKEEIKGELEEEIRKSIKKELGGCDNQGGAGAFTMGVCVLCGMGLASVAIALATPEVMTAAMLTPGWGSSAVYGITKFLAFLGLHSATRGLEMYQEYTARTGAN